MPYFVPSSDFERFLLSVPMYNSGSGQDGFHFDLHRPFVLGGAVVMPFGAVGIRVEQLHFEFGEEYGQGEINFLVRKAVIEIFLGSALEIIVV